MTRKTPTGGERPRLVLVIGADAAGKSRWIKENRHRLPEPIFERLTSATRLARQAKAAQARGNCLEQGTSLTVETTFTRHWRRKLVYAARKRGYRLKALFLTTGDPEINIARVRERHVRGGGDAVRTRAVRGRYNNAEQNLRDWHMMFARIVILDSSGPGDAREIARVDDGRLTLLEDRCDPRMAAIVDRFAR